jgi:hypothetical protein
MNHFEVDVNVNWPKMKLIINSSKGVSVTESFYDTAISNFEVPVTNLLKTIINEIIKKRKESQ